ncbi:hypothetical protein FHR90_003245 [Endobacter medicaginis]|uniref:Uncharacterized protein n=1 Tax=Endobacter medicaginis TaxID=1181271 RepID=A0A839V4A8_9PROT|nr:hypothetical protein [Endobacter medicaginis]MBB3175390.1 hypothetical protein [Endobacter medicaginis]MCX5476732.1 hypothetical protein [Endobacter medicaginis]NVN29338.1 hypothetical protein [Endobacter medicaginis]
MSGTTSITGPLSDSERVDCRRFCGYELYGNGAGANAGYRYFTAYGTLEYRLTNASDAELTVIRTYLSTLQQLETAIITAAANLDTASAAVWVRNPNEVADRQRLFAYQRRQLCGFLGIPPGAGLGDGGSRIVM